MADVSCDRLDTLTTYDDGCPLGHGPSRDVAIVENGYTGRRCPQCGTIFIAPRPRADQVFDLYSHDRAHVPAAAHFAHDDDATLAARHHLRYIRGVCPPTDRNGRRRRLLEIGAGSGAFLRAARASGYDVQGIELNPHQAAAIRASGIPCSETVLADTTFVPDTFDVIYHADVLCHLPDPMADMALMRRLLAPGGVMVFETGNGADIDPKFYPLIPVWQYPDHLAFFGRKSLVELLERAGFYSVEIRSWSIVPQLGFLRAARRQRPQRTSAVIPTSPLGSSRLRLAKAYLLHVIRYGLGRVVSPRGGPETLLVTART